MYVKLCSCYASLLLHHASVRVGVMQPDYASGPFSIMSLPSSGASRAGIIIHSYMIHKPTDLFFHSALSMNRTHAAAAPVLSQSLCHPQLNSALLSKTLDHCPVLDLTELPGCTAGSKVGRQMMMGTYSTNVYLQLDIHDTSPHTVQHFH